MSKCGQVVEEGGGRCVNVHTYVYLYIHIHTHIYSTPNDPAPPHKILEHAVFLSVHLPLFTSWKGVLESLSNQ